jgi:putative peptidoglycan lipid II flippase
VTAPSEPSGPSPSAPHAPVAAPQVLRTALLLLPLQIVLRGGEALLPLLLAAWFGRSEATDAYMLLGALYTFLGSIVVAAFQDSVLIPVVTELRLKRPAELGPVVRGLFGATLVTTLAASAVASVLGLGHALFATTGARSRLELAMIVPLALLVIAMGCRAFLVGLANAHQRYALHPAASGLGMGLTLLGLSRTSSLGIAVLPWWLVAGEGTAVAVLFVAVSRTTGLTLRPALVASPEVRRFLRMVASEAGGSAVTRINPVVDQAFAAATGFVGGGTLLRYTFDIAGLPLTVLQATVFPILVGAFAHRVTVHGAQTLGPMVLRALAATTAFVAALAGLLHLFREPILALAFGHGEMDTAGLARMAEILPYALAGAVPFGCLLVLARAHVSLQNARIMFPLGVLNAAANLALNAVLVRPLGLEGLALSTSLVQLLLALAFAALLVRRLREERR